MKREKVHVLMAQLGAVLLLTLACLLLCCPPDKRPILKDFLKDYKVHFGLDLKGGSELLYQIDPNQIDTTRNIEDVVEETIGVISQRIFESNIVKEPRIQRQGENRILIQLPGLNQTETALIKREIERLGNLEFRLVASKKIGKGIDEEEERPKYERAKKGGIRRLKRYIKRLLRKGYKWFPSRNKKGRDRLLWIKDGYDFIGKKFKRFYITYADAQKVIGFELKDEYKSYFANFTQKYDKEYLAIVFNNEVVAAPRINGRIPGIGIMTGFKIDEIKELMKILKSGSLEIQPELLNENTIGPSLGEDAIKRGISAGIIGLIIVIVFMIFYYKGLGIIADIALILNLIIIFAILVIWGETLTLPGIAGIILTIGMSVDANIIIFERIREEKKKLLATLGKPIDDDSAFNKAHLLEIIEKGYERAFWTIFDANITTLITAIILYFFGSGPVQGFAFTLGWGIIASFFTAVLVTRIIINLLIERGTFKKLAMKELIRNPKFRFSEKMRLCATVSFILIVLGITLFLYRGDENYGLDLKGGILAEISLEKPLKTEEVRARLKDKFKVEVQHIVTPNGSFQKGWYEFSIRLPNLHQKEIEKIRKKIEKITAKLRVKNSALKEFTSMIIRAEEDLRIAKRKYRRAKREKWNKEDIEEIKSEIRRYERIIKDNKSNIERLSKEANKLKDERSKLIQRKNELAGIEVLRKEIEEKFKNELSPLPFGKLREGERKFSSYHVLPVRMKTPVSAKFVLDTLRDKIDIFEDLYIGEPEYEILAKIKDNKIEDIKRNIKKHLDILYRITPKEIKVEKLENNKEYNYKILIYFQKPVPEFALNTAIEKCNWKAKVTPLYNGKYDLKKFWLYILLPGEFSLKSMEYKQKVVEEKIRNAFKEKIYKGKTVYLSNPFPRFTQISGVVARAQKAKAYQSIILALILILLYIAVRFPNGFIFGTGAVIALMHDVLITLGAIAFFAFTGLVDVEINLPIIAALLTIVGYSLNDTIVIFDRIRETRERDKNRWENLTQKDIAKEFDSSLNQTLSRTILTSLTTLFVLLVIFVLNYAKGSVMEGFSFTLIVGVIVGTYSSIFIASYFVLHKEKKGRLS